MWFSLSVSKVFKAMMEMFNVVLFTSWQHHINFSFAFVTEFRRARIWVWGNIQWGQWQWWSEWDKADNFLISKGINSWCYWFVLYIGLKSLNRVKGLYVGWQSLVSRQSFQIFFLIFHISLISQSMSVSTEIAVLLILLHSVFWTLICKTITFYDWQGHVTWQSFAKGL